MTCQKCRSPLKLDGSLEDLNPAAFDILVGSTGKSLPDSKSSASTRRQPYPQDRKETLDHASRHSSTPAYKRTIPGSRHGQGTAGSQKARLSRGDSQGMSFVMLTESQVVPPQVTLPVNTDGKPSRINGRTNSSAGEQEVEEEQFPHQVERTTRLFEILSAHSDIDHPICVECTELLVEGLQKRLMSSTKERDAYISVLKNLNSSLPTPEEVEAAEQSLKKALDEEAAAWDDLLALEKEKDSIDDEIAALEEESRQVDLEEEDFWRERNAFASKLSEFQNERDALNTKYDHDSRHLERLQRTNVYNDTFCIGHDGYFGTINGLRLGRLANPSVEWAEINAAWGQTLLLLATVAEKLGFQFRGYRLKPMGSSSKIEKIEYPQQSATDSSPGARQQQSSTATAKVTVLELFSSGDLPLNLPWLHRRFDAGMVAFLECLRQLGAFVEATTAHARSSHPHAPSDQAAPAPAAVAGLRLPYEIKRDKIGDASIKLGFNQNDETWTRACKYTLTCCKFLLAHASNVASSGSNSATAMAAANSVPGPGRADAGAADR